jgi:hypothetical protein
MTAKGWISVGTAGALLVAGIAMIVFTEERDIGIMLVLTALASAGVPAVWDFVPPKGPPTPPAGGSALLLVLLPMLLVGCGAAQVSAETARVAACEEAEAYLERRFDAGVLAREEAFAQIDGVRVVCDILHAKIVEVEL